MKSILNSCVICLGFKGSQEEIKKASINEMQEIPGTNLKKGKKKYQSKTFSESDQLNIFDRQSSNNQQIEDEKSQIANKSFDYRNMGSTAQLKSKLSTIMEYNPSQEASLSMFLKDISKSEQSIARFQQIKKQKNKEKEQ